ncbi:seminal metalloprotease 1-like [Cydia splendana]|uniref:seminal metalloprotease 1-like n=1 Tax=Cydia splendana TaxID=1100963 RepID=UPI0028F49C4A
MKLFIFAGLLTVVANAAPIHENINKGEEFGEHFEGDMVLLPWQQRAVSTAIDARNGLRGAAKRWPDRTVVYHIEEDDFDEDQVKLIEEGMADIASKSCIKFRPRKKDDEHSVVIQGSANGCFSNVGFSSQDDEGDASQVLNLSNGCFRHGTVVHEMLHTLGFYHMQSTYDRDEFVNIVWENIRAGTEHNFAKYTNDTVTDFGVPYDFDSVMHYPETAFSKNGNKTIIPLQENVKIGQRDGLSESDILKLNKMYCDESNTLKITHRSK